MNTFHLTTYDGNPREWSRSQIETDREGFMWPLMDHLCNLNEANYDCPIGPVKYLVELKYSALLCSWTMGQETWPFIIIVSSTRLDNIETASIVSLLGADLGDDEE